MKKFFKENGFYFINVECPECQKIHKVSHKNFYSQRSGKRNLSLRCIECSRLKSAKKRRNPNLQKTSHGYIKFYRPENPMADKRGEVYEHRLVMSKTLGRTLQKWEHVHHKDGNRSNNKPENLELFPKNEHGPIKDMVERIKFLENLLIQNKIPF